MPHYVIQLEREDEFAVYSTVVDNLITPTMSAMEMRAHLEDRGYGSWLTNDNSDLVAFGWSEEDRERITRDRERTARYMYWHEDEMFKYAKLSDAYFCLPREAWRDE